VSFACGGHGEKPCEAETSFVGFTQRKELTV
jgi:hypothetical protein